MRTRGLGWRAPRSDGECGDEGAPVVEGAGGDEAEAVGVDDGQLGRLRRAA